MLRTATPTTTGRRHLVTTDRSELKKSGPEKSLLLPGYVKRQGRGFKGHITMRHRGGGMKKKIRIIDWKRNKTDVVGVVKSIEYDPLRSANLALVFYTDGDKSYILAPEGLKVGGTVVSSVKAEPLPGNAMELKNIPIGVPIHNLEIRKGKGAQLVRGAGNAALIQAKDEKFVTILLPSKEQRLINADCFATIGQVGNQDWKNRKLGKAGRSRWMGIRPTVRGSAMHPNNHPHGGGEGRSGVGLKYQKTPWGKIAAPGKKTRDVHKSKKLIVKDRRVK
ncbi:MAG TPA: 50S ribosomal protein L2 [Candidatus Pacebacteria bacterium]|nr:50S ribosomal protein L2 [Candidatus Paceibacterota bacterium]